MTGRFSSSAWRDHLDRVQDLNVATLKREADCEIARILRCCEFEVGAEAVRAAGARSGGDREPGARHRPGSSHPAPPQATVDADSGWRAPEAAASRRSSSVEKPLSRHRCRHGTNPPRHGIQLNIEREIASE